MMNLGSLAGYGSSSSSSSSSSTLSPLAQPFTVDRSWIPKPKPATLPHAFDDCYDSIPPRPSLDNWLHLHPPTPASNPFPTSGADYGDFCSLSISSSGIHLPSLDPVSGSLSYGQKSGSKASSLIDAEPYYPQYSPTAIENCDLGMKESGFGLSKSGCVAALDGKSPSDFVQNLCGFGYNQLKDLDSNWKGRSGQEEVLSNYGRSLQKGGPSAEGFMLQEEVSDGMHGKGIQSSITKVHIGSKGTSSPWFDVKRSGISDGSTSVPSHSMAKTSFVAPGSVLKEMPYSQQPEPASPLEVWTPFKQNTPPYDRFFSENEVSNPTIFYPPVMAYSSPGQVFVPPASDSSSVVVKSSNQAMDADNGEYAVGHASANVNVPFIQLNATGKGYVDTSRISNYMTKGDYTFVDPAEVGSANVKVPSAPTNASECNEHYSDKTRISNGTRKDDYILVDSTPVNVNSPFKTPRLLTGESVNHSSKEKVGQLPDIFAGSFPVKISLPSNTKAALNKSSNQSSKLNLELEHHIFPVPSSVRISSPSNPRPIIDDSLKQSSNDKSDMELRHLNIPNPSSLAPGAVGPAESEENSSETFDQLIAEDSPCWKGALASRHSPFGNVGAGADFHSVPKKLEGCSNLNQEGQAPCVNHDGAGTTTPKLCGSFTHHEAGRIEDSKAGDENGSHCSDALKELGGYYVLAGNPNSSSGLKISKPFASGQEDVSSCFKKFASNARITETETEFDAAKASSGDLYSHAMEHSSNASSSEVSTSSEILRVLGSSDDSEVCLVRRLDAQNLVMTIFNMSELLLSGHFGDVNTLGDHDCEVVQLAMDNLHMYLHKKVGSKGPVPESFSLKSMRKAMEESVHDKAVEHTQVLVYKNLWFESEAALCSVKHELARMKIEMEKYEQHREKGEVNKSVQHSVLTKHVLPPAKSISTAADSHCPSDAAGMTINEEKPSSLTANDNIFEEGTSTPNSEQGLSENVATIEEAAIAGLKKLEKVNVMSLKVMAEDISAPKGKEGSAERVSVVRDDVNMSSCREPMVLNQSRKEVEDGESSVLARFRINQSRIHCFSSMNKVGQQHPPLSSGPGGHLLFGPVSNPHSLEWKSMGLQTETLDPGFPEKMNPWHPPERCLEITRRLYDSNVSQPNEMTKDFRPCIANEPAIETCMLGLSAGRINCPSSEWEHVLKEELKW